MVKTILFATDLGVYTPVMLHHVNLMAQQHNARVILVHAVEPPGHMGEAVVETYLNDDARQELEHFGIKRIIKTIKHKVLEQLEEDYLDGQDGLSNIRDVRVMLGHPVEVILEQAVVAGADLIMLGSHGQHSCTSNLLGSVASKVLHLARVPVYLVPLARNVAQQVAPTCQNHPQGRF